MKDQKTRVEFKGERFIWLKEAQVLGIMKLGLKEYGVYSSLRLHADKRNGDTWISQQTIANETGLSRPKVIEALKNLESHEFIEIFRDPERSTLTYYVF